MFLINGLYKCLEPNDVTAALEAEGLPADIVSKANSWTVQHGPTPNTGYFLISYQDYQNIADKKLPEISLVIQDYEGNEVEFEHLTLTAATNIFGKGDTATSVVLIKLEDYRWWMKRIYCEDIRKNWIATNRDFDNAYLQVNTTNSGVFFPLNTILSEILSTFRSQANNAQFDSATYAEATAYTDQLNNIDFSGMSILDAINRLCETSRLNYIVRPNGSVYFNSGLATWPASNQEFASNIDAGPLVIPTTITSICQDQNYKLYDDRCDNDRPSTTFTEDYSPAGATVGSTQFIRVPYIEHSNYLDNASSITSILDTIASRFLNILKAQPRRTYCRGYVNFHDNINFGLDEVSYVNRGQGVITIATGKELHQYYLNYIDPPFPVYHADPHGIFLYRFTIKEDWLSPGSPNAKALCDIFRHTGVNTGYDDYVHDPFNIFEDLNVGDSGWCIEICDILYAIQAPCVDPI